VTVWYCDILMSLLTNLNMLIFTKLLLKYLLSNLCYTMRAAKMLYKICYISCRMVISRWPNLVCWTQTNSIDYRVRRISFHKHTNISRKPAVKISLNLLHTFKNLCVCVCVCIYIYIYIIANWYYMEPTRYKLLMEC
jgi:hypothetical protein